MGGTSSLAESLGSGHTAAGWAKDFLTAIGAPASDRNVNAVIVWEDHESGGGGGQYNPLNTTQSGYNGESSINSVGVKNYVTYEDGIAANAQAFNSGARRGLYGYDQILAAFNNSSGTMFDIFSAVNRSSWGTKSLPTDPSGSLAPIQDVKGDGTSGAGAGGGSSSSGGTNADGTPADAEHCILTLPGIKLPSILPDIGGGCLLDSAKGRAILGFVTLGAGGLLMLVGLGFVAIGGNAGKAIRLAA